MSIGDTIKAARKNKGLSQRELGEMVGVTKTAVGKWENDEAAPNRSRALAVAMALGLSPKDVQEHSRVGLTLLDDNGRERMIPVLSMGDFLSVALREDDAGLAGFPTISADVDEKEDALALRIDNAEMADEVNDGDVVIVSRSALPRDDDLVIAFVDDQIVLRRYRSRGRDAGGKEAYDLYSNNPEVATRTVNRRHPGQILAVVLEHRRRRQSLRK